MVLELPDDGSLAPEDLPEALHSVSAPPGTYYAARSIVGARSNAGAKRLSRWSHAPRAAAPPPPPLAPAPAALPERSTGAAQFESLALEAIRGRSDDLRAQLVTAQERELAAERRALDAERAAMLAERRAADAEAAARLQEIISASRQQHTEAMHRLAEDRLRLEIEREQRDPFDPAKIDALINAFRKVVPLGGGAPPAEGSPQSLPAWPTDA